jgi:protein-tyrosine-phosphatase
VKLLFVCTGNICRSLMAERIALKLAQERGLAVEAKSCGVAAESYYRPPKEIAAALSSLGCVPDGHRAQLVTRDLLAWCDRALVMTQRHQEILRDLFPEHARKVSLLHPEGRDIDDPMGRPQKVYDSCRDVIRDALDPLLK